MPASLTRAYSSRQRGRLFPTLILAPVLALSACAETGALPFAATGDASARSAAAGMRQTAFANGAVRLTPPRGYCIDPGSVRSNPQSGFALIARCDRFGISGFFGSRSLALISVTVSNKGGARQPGLSDLEAAVAGAEILDRAPESDPPMIRLRAPDSSFAGAGSIHWRSAFSVNGHMVALGLYAPGDDITANPSASTGLLRELARRTRAASQTAATPAKPVATPPAKPASDVTLRPKARPGTPRPAPGLLGKITGLFD